MTHSKADAHGHNAIPFIDDATKDALLWADIWAMFQPVTPYGLRAKATMQPYRVGDEPACQATLLQLADDERVYDDDQLAQARTRLARFHDVQGTLAALERADYVLSPKEALGLKQFGIAGHEWLAESSCESLGEASGEAQSKASGQAAWLSLLQPFGDTVSATFSLAHLADEEYKQLLAQVSQQTQQASALMRAQDVIWQQRTGQRPTKDRLLIVRLPQDKGLAETLKADGTVSWLRDTPFESVFEVVRTEAMLDAEEKLAQLKQVLDLAGQKLLQTLTHAVRQQFSLWQTAIETVTAHDIRFAKLQMLRTWQGSVPVLTDASWPQGGLEVVDAVHPVVQSRLGKHGQSYVPLILTNVSAVNVISGSNMGGKTVTMSLLCICQALLQYGLPVPAKQFQSRLFSVVRFVAAAQTELHHGLSSFGQEVYQLSKAWQDAENSAPGLVCFDEPGRSTNPWEGEAIAIGIIRSAVQRERTLALAHANSSSAVPKFASATRSASEHVVWMASHFSGVLREPGITRFRVRGLQGGDWVNTAGAGDGLSHARRSDEDVMQARIAQLQSLMDYRVEYVGDDSATYEALRVAEWLGLPEPLLRASRQFLQEREEMNGV